MIRPHTGNMQGHGRLQILCGAPPLTLDVSKFSPTQQFSCPPRAAATYGIRGTSEKYVSLGTPRRSELHAEGDPS